MKNKKLLCPRGYITSTYLHKGAGWSVGNCLNLDSADESDKDRYAKNLIPPFNLRQSWLGQGSSECICSGTS